MRWLYRLFNHDKIDDMQRTIDIYKERNNQLENELIEYKGYKLKYEVTKLYVDDDEALLEIFEAAKERKSNTEMTKYNQLIGIQARQQNVFSLGGGVTSVLGQSSFFGLR